jgi:ketosteroid isomerase-like protein
VASANAEVVRANSRAFSRRDVDAMLELHAPGAVVSDRRAVGWGEFRGHDALRSYYAGLFDNAAELDEQLEIVSEEDGLIVASCVLTARLADQPDAGPVAFSYALRIRLAGGLITSVEIYEDARAAREVDPLHDVALRFAEALNARDTDALIALATDDVGCDPLQISVSGSYEGHDGVRRWMRELTTHDPGHRVRLERVATIAPDRAAVFGTLVMDGRPVSPYTLVVIVRDGRVAATRSYLTDEETLTTLGLLA